MLSFRILLVGVRNTLYSLMNKFLWGGSNNARKLHLVNRNIVTMPIEMGSLGIFRLEELNSALIVK